MPETLAQVFSYEFCEISKNTFFTEHIRTTASASFCSGLLWKHELSLRSSHWNCSVKKVFLENLKISLENNCVDVSFSYSCRPLGLQLYYGCFLMKFMQFLRIPNLKSASDCFWNLFFHVDSLFNNLRFCLPVPSSLLLTQLQLEAVGRWCSVKKVFQQISQISHENTSSKDAFLMKLQIYTV